MNMDETVKPFGVRDIKLYQWQTDRRTEFLRFAYRVAKLSKLFSIVQ